MKKRLLSVLAVFMVFAMIFVLSGCEEEEPLPDIMLDDLVGTWTREISGGTDTYIFSKNMKYSHNKAGALSIGTFTVSGSTLTLTASETGKSSDHTVQINGDSMVWGRGSVTAEYTRS